MKLRPLNDTTVLKSTDNATEIQLAVTSSVDEILDLSSYASVSVAIGVNGTQYSSESVTIAEDKQSFTFTISHALPASIYNVEVTLQTVDGKSHIAPSEGNFPLRIEKSMNELGETVTIMSVAELLNDIAIVKRQSEENAELVNDNNEKVTLALETIEASGLDATEALRLANESKVDSSTAKENADGAIRLSTEANASATTATSTANTAKNTADLAQIKADEAHAKATIAKETADLVRSEFNELTEGNADAEVIGARTNANNVSFDSLKQRLDDADDKRVVGIANAIQSANAYTDNAIGNVDLSSVDEHVNNADVHVTTVDKDNWNNKVDGVNGKGLSTNDYTTADKDKLASLQNVDASTLATKAELTNHADSTSHITLDERAKWNEVVDDEATHKSDSATHNTWVTCATASASTAKVGTASGFTLATGSTVRVKFTNANTADTPTLNVNSTGAKAIKKADGTAFTKIVANGVYSFVYDGSNFIVQGEGGGDYSLGDTISQGNLKAIGTLSVLQHWQYTGHTASVRCVASKDNYIYSGGDDTVVRKLDLNKNLIWSYTGHTGAVLAIVVDADGNVYSASNDRTVKKINSSGTLIWSYSTSGAVWGIDVDSSGNVYYADGENYVRKLTSGGAVIWNIYHSGGARCVTVDATGNVYSGGNDNTLKKSNSSGTLIWSYTGHTSSVLDIVVDVDGNVYTASADKSIRKINSSGVLVWSYTGHTGAVWAICLDKFLNVYTASEDTTAKKIDSNGTLIWTTEKYANASQYDVILDKNNNILLAGGDKNLRKLVEYSDTYQITGVD